MPLQCSRVTFKKGKEIGAGKGDTLLSCREWKLHFFVQNAGIWKIAKALKQCNDINFVLLYTFHFQTFIIKKMLSKNDQNLKALFKTKANQEKKTFVHSKCKRSSLRSQC